MIIVESVNEDSQVYFAGTYSCTTMTIAFKNLKDFPNDHIRISYKEDE